jgi:hypothetical protein
MSKSKKITLILERGDGKLWGRALVNDNLIVDYANNLPALEKKLKKVLLDFEGLANIEFDYAYDLTVFFETFNFLNQSKIAEIAGINPGLIRQYSSGQKNPSAQQVLKIQKAIHALATTLKSVQLSAKAA